MNGSQKNLKYENNSLTASQTTLLSERCQCGCEPLLKPYQSCSKSLQVLSLHYKIEDFPHLKRDYERLLSYPIDDLQARQIIKDIDRTHPLIEFFKKKNTSDGPQQLERVLQCISKYDPAIGYVQGMNYMIGGLLYHSEEYVAFWNFVVAYEKLELRDIYLPNLPGLSKHIQITELLLMSSEPLLYKHLILNQVVFAIFCTPLFFSLFGMVIPIQEYVFLFIHRKIDFFYKLMKQNWIFVYKIILSYIKCQKNLILSMEGPELFTFLTQANHHIQGQEKNHYFETWSEAVKKADEIIVDNKFVKTMLSNFDLDRQRFKIQK